MAVRLPSSHIYMTAGSVGLHSRSQSVGSCALRSLSRSAPSQACQVPRRCTDRKVIRPALVAAGAVRGRTWSTNRTAWRSEMMHSASRARGAHALVIVLLLALAASAFVTARPAPSLAGEWDVYIALSARPHFGFEGWRRMGFAHFAGADSGNVGL